MRNDEKSKETLDWYQEFNVPIKLSAIAFALFLLLFWLSNLDYKEIYMHFGEVGDVFAGVSASLAFIWLVYGNIQTGRSIKMHQRELGHTIAEMEAQRAIMKLQFSENRRANDIAEENLKALKRELFFKQLDNSKDMIVARIINDFSGVYSLRGFNDAITDYSGSLARGTYKQGHMNKDLLIMKISERILALKNVVIKFETHTKLCGFLDAVKINYKLLEILFDEIEEKSIVKKSTFKNNLLVSSSIGDLYYSTKVLLDNYDDRIKLENKDNS
jgi:hypothetical protein